MQTSLSATQARLGACRVQTRRQLRLGVMCAAKQKQQQQQKVQYGANWYEQTRAATTTRTVREEIAYRKAANQAANNGRERKDLYTDNWDGSEYKGSGWNILTVLGLLFVLVPVAGLAFAYQSYGVLWG